METKRKKKPNRLTNGPNDAFGVVWARFPRFHLPCRVFRTINIIF